MDRFTLCMLVLPFLLLGCQTTGDLASKEMVYVEGGEFLMGTSNEVIDSLINVYGYPRGFIASEYPPHGVKISSFYIDKYEVTNAEFKTFVDKNPIWQKENIPDSLHNGDYLKHWSARGFPTEKASHPVTYITWYAAVEYCKCLNKRLPTEAEWEYVARSGGKSNIYPWGNTLPDSTKTNYFKHVGSTTPGGSYPPNELGVNDLAGNVWEYTLDAWSSDFYQQSPQSDPVNGLRTYELEDLLKIKSRRVIRGGSWGGADVNLRNAFRDSHPPEGAGDHVGFRCAMDALPD